jgi:two-component system NtrC family sensor kinase
LFTLLFLVMAAGFAIFAYLSSATHTHHLMSQVGVAGTRAADILVRSADYAMLQNRRDMLTRMIRDVGGEPGIEVARIYNKRGMIAMSSDSTEEGRIVDMQAEACNVCHASGGVLRRVSEKERSRVVDRTGRRSLGVIQPIYNREACSGPPCHAHSLDQTVLGLLEVRMSLAGVDQALSRGRWQVILMGASLTLLVAGVAGYFVQRVVHRPVLNLTRGTREVASGNLSVRLPVEGSVELASLAEAFNRMAEALAKAHAENAVWSETLEKRVLEKTAELETMHQRMLQVEKMASLGQLAATVAHELNNPLSGILTYAKLLQRRALKHGDPLPEELKFIADETQRCGQIVKNLLLFARRGIGEVAPHDVAQVTEEALKIVAHHIELNHVTLNRDLRALTVVCDGSQIRQALVALLVNAIEAMRDGGELNVSTRPEPEREGVRFAISDTGSGINPEDLKHIFEPFYTSKPEGKGVGLGLAVVYGIVSRHGGSIDVNSTPGAGTTFTVHLPLAPREHTVQREAQNV